MIMHKYLSSFTLCLVVFGCVLFSAVYPVAAQDGRIEGDYGTTKENAAAIEKLKNMSPEEIKRLDEFMTQALTFYYDRKFAQALPIFKELADKVETMGIMFWLGTSAAKIGEVDLAIEKFKKMLSIDPDLHRVRLELASVYFATGRNEEAEKELAIVRAADAPPEVKANINRMLAAIDERNRRYFWNARLSVGFLWDDNISAGPDPGIYTIPGGQFRPSQTSSKLSDQGSVTAFAGNYLYDFGKKRGFMWNTAASFYRKAYLNYSEFNYTTLDLNTGPWWSWRQSILKIPVGYTHTEYGSDRLSYILHVDPSYEYFFNPNFSLRGTYIYKKETFFQRLRSRFDNTTQIFDLSPTIYLANRRHIIGVSLAFDRHSAENDAYTYNAPIFGVNYFTRFPTQTELYLGYQWTDRDYDGQQDLPYFGLQREDERHYYSAVLSQVFYKYFNASYAFTYTKNNSNLDLNEWDKTTHTISIGCQF